MADASFSHSLRLTQALAPSLTVGLPKLGFESGLGLCFEWPQLLAHAPLHAMFDLRIARASISAENSEQSSSDILRNLSTFLRLPSVNHTDRGKYWLNSSS